MRANILLTWVVLGVLSLHTPASADLKYVKLNATNMAQLDSAISTIEQCGGRLACNCWLG